MRQIHLPRWCGLSSVLYALGKLASSENWIKCDMLKIRQRCNKVTTQSSSVARNRKQPRSTFNLVICRLVAYLSADLVGLESLLKSIFAGLVLGLGLGKICNQVHFQFSLCTFEVFCLNRITFCKPVSYTQPKICYLLNIYCGINPWTCLCDSIYIVLIF